MNAAIEAGSYDALLWLQDRLGVKLDTISDGSGNELLHMICRFPNVYRFFEKVNALGHGSNGSSKALIHLKSLQDPLANRCNAADWVYDAVVRKDLRALELILSLHHHVGSNVLYYVAIYDKDVLMLEMADKLQAENVVLGARMMTGLMNLISCRDLYHQVLRDETNVDLLSGQVLAATPDPTPVVVAKRLARFSCDESIDQGWPGTKGHALDRLIQDCCSHGSIGALRFMVAAGVQLSAVRSLSQLTTVDKGEFLQPELSKLRAEETRSLKEVGSSREALDLVGLAVHGQGLVMQSHWAEYVDEYSSFIEAQSGRT